MTNKLYNIKTNINADKVKKSIYFITSLIQNQRNDSMYGTLSSRGDKMGGIFDRWINTIPESVILNDIIIPYIKANKKSELISDFYLYDPKIVGIAPDVIGLKIFDKTGYKIVPFVEYKDEWVAKKNMPQIEIKTFKESQKMVSLRNQGYDNKYLIFAETNFRIDYQLPFFDLKNFSKNVYNELIMDDNIFIISNEEKHISSMPPVNIENNSLGTLRILKIMKTNDFIKLSNLCGSGIVPYCIKSIELYNSTRNISIISINITEYLENKGNNVYSFNNRWQQEFNVKDSVFLDIYLDKPEAIEIIKINKNSYYFKALDNCRFNDTDVSKNSIYKVELNNIPRSDNKNEEYFMHKSLLNTIPDFADDLCKALKNIIEE